MAFQDLPRSSRLYIALLVVAGAGAILFSLQSPFFRQPDLSLVVFFILALATARMNVKIPFTSVHFSVDTAFVFVILMTYGLLPALATDVVGKLILSFTNIKRSALFKVPFNVASGVLSVYAGYLAYKLLFFGNPSQYENFILPVLGMTAAYYVVNTFSVAIAICISERLNLISFWIKNFLPTGIGYLTSGSVATLLFLMESSGGVLGFVVTIPIVLLIYFSQKIYSQKEEEALHHIEELEHLHLTTIQSLSLAIDAKDEYTHGHVHRVRSYAVGLAEKLGVLDKDQIKGLSFSALVHDIGKIAIPDAILNKKGKYSEREFLRMQIHPVVGSEILKTIPLPFPVAKIVRAHHEKWNGRGYPDGLAGTEIPYEGRILAVADVYDAIRSSRPYRPKMEKERAIDIMKKEKGVSLDPTMVEMFLTHLDELEQEAELDESKIQDIVRASYMSMNLEDSMEEEEETSTSDMNAQRTMFLFNGLSHLFDSGYSLRETLSELAIAIGKVVPYNAMVAYMPDSDMNLDLLPVFMDGKDSEILRENTICVGEGISGWVYAERTPTIRQPEEDEFPHIDLRPVPYKSCLSFPLICLNRPVCVVTLYSENDLNFKGEDQDLLMKVSPIIGPIVKNLAAQELEQAERKDAPQEAEQVPLQ